VPDQPTKVVGRRVAAWAIDFALWLLVSAALWIALTGRLDADTSRGGGFVIGGTRYAFTSSTNRAIWLALMVLAAIVIFVILPGLRGTSPGKALLRIRVVGADGSPPGLGRALLLFATLVVFDNFPIGFVAALASNGNQRVGDMLSSTWVVRAEAAGRPIAELVPEAGEEGRDRGT